MLFFLLFFLLLSFSIAETHVKGIRWKNRYTGVDQIERFFSGRNYILRASSEEIETRSSTEIVGLRCEVAVLFTVTIESHATFRRILVPMVTVESRGTSGEINYYPLAWSKLFISR